MNNIDDKFLASFLVELLNTPSPTGFTEGANNFERTNLDALVATTRWVLAYLMEP